MAKRSKEDVRNQVVDILKKYGIQPAKNNDHNPGQFALDDNDTFERAMLKLNAIQIEVLLNIRDGE